MGNSVDKHAMSNADVHPLTLSIGQHTKSTCTSDPGGHKDLSTYKGALIFVLDQSNDLTWSKLALHNALIFFESCRVREGFTLAIVQDEIG